MCMRVNICMQFCMTWSLCNVYVKQNTTIHCSEDIQTYAAKTLILLNEFEPGGLYSGWRYCFLRGPLCYVREERLKTNLTECSMLPQLEMMRDLAAFCGTLKREGRGTTSCFLCVPGPALCISYFMSLWPQYLTETIPGSSTLLWLTMSVFQSQKRRHGNRHSSAQSRRAGACGRVCLHHRGPKSIKSSTGTKNWVELFKGWPLCTTSTSQVPPPKGPKTSQSREQIFKPWTCGKHFRFKP